MIAGSWILNSLNLYSTALSVEATFPHWHKKWVIMLLGLVGIMVKERVEEGRSRRWCDWDVEVEEDDCRGTREL